MLMTRFAGVSPLDIISFDIVMPALPPDQAMHVCWLNP